MINPLFHVHPPVNAVKNPLVLGFGRSDDRFPNMASQTVAEEILFR